MQFRADSNVEWVRHSLSQVAQKQLPFAASVALNAVAKEAVEVNRRQMARVFDRPTRWTLNAFHFRRATKGDLTAKIERKDAARGRHYLEVQEKGGARPFTGIEKQLAQRLATDGHVGYVMPTKHVRRDAHGNVHRGEMQRILSRIGAQGDRAANTTERSLKRAKGAGQYFVAPTTGRLAPGVWIRDAAGRLRRVLAFNADTPSYKPRLRFYQVLGRHAQMRLPGVFAKALAAALATAR